jgi:hypothetical protein
MWKEGGGGRIEGIINETNNKKTGNAVLLILPNVHPGLSTSVLLVRYHAVFCFEKAPPSKATDEEQIDGASLSVVTSS